MYKYTKKYQKEYAKGKSIYKDKGKGKATKVKKGGDKSKVYLEVRERETTSG